MEQQREKPAEHEAEHEQVEDDAQTEVQQESEDHSVKQETEDLTGAVEREAAWRGTIALPRDKSMHNSERTV